MKKFALIVWGLCVFSSVSFAKAKEPHARAKPRVLVFDSTNPDVRPVFDFEVLTPQKVSSAPILFLTTGEETSGKDLLLDEGKASSSKGKH